MFGNYDLFDDIEKNIYEFESILSDTCGKRIPSSSNYYNLAENLLDIIAGYKKEIEHDTKVDVRKTWRRALGLYDLIKKFINARSDEKLKEFCPHLDLLFGGANIVQNDFSKSIDQETNKIFELFIGLSSLYFCDQIKLEEPSQANSTNPDLLIESDGILWGIACKTLHSDNPKTFANRLIEGIKQIDKSPADKGFVMFNFKNLIDHDEVWSMHRQDIKTKEYYYSTYSNISSRVEAMIKSQRGIQNSIFEVLGKQTHINDLFENSKSIPLTVNYFSSVTAMFINGQPTLAPLKHLTLFPFIDIDAFNKESIEFINKLNFGLQDISVT